MYDKVTIPINEFSFSLLHSFCVMWNIYCSEEMNRVVELSRWKGVSVNMAINFAALQWQKLQSEKFSEKRKRGFVDAQKENAPRS